jgi:putative transposase
VARHRSRGTTHPLLKPIGQEQAEREAAHAQKVHELYAQIGKLTTQLEWLGKKLACTMNREERIALLDTEPSATCTEGLSVLSMRAQTQLLGLNRSSLYYQPQPPSQEELLLKRRIDEIYTARPFYGYRRIAVQLQQEGHRVNRKAVARHMQEMGLSAICPRPHRPNLSKRAQQHSVYPYLLRGVIAHSPNHIWGVDLTYIRMVGGYPGWLYLVAVLDWYSRYIVSWELSQKMEQSFVMEAARAALSTAIPTIWNSDRGSQFTSPQYTALLTEAGVTIDA